MTTAVMTVLMVMMTRKPSAVAAETIPDGRVSVLFCVPDADRESETGASLFKMLAYGNLFI
ncbi:hypothetical protein GCM10009000_046940 [Halobacterium noricense]|uniref:Uncharacterized protein n=1 Tax=Haladaptatus pallidirubidus TaxID=1008152 RepID=A0AAV3UFE2_9EURY